MKAGDLVIRADTRCGIIVSIGLKHQGYLLAQVLWSDGNVIYEPQPLLEVINEERITRQTI